MNPMLDEESAAYAAHAPATLPAAVSQTAGATSGPLANPEIGETGAAREAAEVAAWQPALGRFIEPAWAAICQQPASDAIAIDYAALEPQLKAELCQQLLLHAKRTLVLELNVARLLGTLHGDTPEQRFDDFISRFRSHPQAWEALLGEYPILGERLQLAQQRFITNLTEVLSCLVRDWAAIAERFPKARRCTHLFSVSGGLSDGHRGGRSVMRLTFRCGSTAAPEAAAAPGQTESFHLLFKPKDLQVDQHFQELLGFCNAAAERGELTLSGLRHGHPAAAMGAEFPHLYQQRLLPRAGYGWVEYLAAADCADQAAVQRFYVRQGGFLALLHVLQGTDLHYENLIACGEHPVLVDLETLFHQPFRPRSYAEDAGARAEQQLEESVLRTGLLPGRAWGGGDRPGINLGGLGNEDGQAVPQVTAGFIDCGTDEMKLAVRQSYLPRGRNLPRIRDQIAPAVQYVEEIVAGFEAMLRFVCSQRVRWLSAEAGPLAGFAGDEVRHIVRATTVYAKLLAAATHPDHLRSDKARDALLHILADSDAHVPPAVVRTETAELRRGDVPFFTAHPGSRDLWDGEGVCHRDYFATDCMTTVRSRISGLDDAELDRQVFLIRAALSASAFGMRITTPAMSPQSAPMSAAPHPLAQQARAVAAELGEKLFRSAIRGPQDATWIGMKLCGETACEVAPVDADLYDGQAGITLFLSYLGKTLGERKFIELAQAAAQRLQRLVLAAPERGAGDEYGGFVGLPSQLYALSHAAAVLGEPRLVRGLGPVLDRLHRAAHTEAPLASDVIYGSAGAILALLSLHSVTGEDAALATAAQFGRRLIKEAIASPAGLAWRSHAAAVPLLGFAHGTAGIYCALTRLAKAVAAFGGLGALADEFTQVAAAALAHERACFDPAEQNWPDLRTPEPRAPDFQTRDSSSAGPDPIDHAKAPSSAAPKRFMRAWCHGAPGVLLSRVAAPAVAPSGSRFVLPAGAADEVAIAVRTTLAAESPEHGLCHGEIGNLLIVSQAAAALSRADWQEQVDARLRRVLDSLRAAPPRCGFLFADAAPSLMTGLSGVGYGLLGLAAAAEKRSAIPCVLALAPPATAPSSSAGRMWA